MLTIIICVQFCVNKNRIWNGTRQGKSAARKHYEEAHRRGAAWARGGGQSPEWSVNAVTGAESAVAKTSLRVGQLLASPLQAIIQITELASQSLLLLCVLGFVQLPLQHPRLTGEAVQVLLGFVNTQPLSIEEEKPFLQMDGTDIAVAVPCPPLGNRVGGRAIVLKPPVAPEVVFLHVRHDTKCGAGIAVVDHP